MLHDLTHRHFLASKEGVGVFALCSWRLPRSRCRVHFQPEIDGAGWHEVPLSGPDGERAWERMLLASTPMEAMAILREAS